MNENHSFDLIKAIVLLTDQLQLMANSLEHIETQLSNISTNVTDAGINVANAIDDKPGATLTFIGHLLPALSMEASFSSY